MRKESVRKSVEHDTWVNPELAEEIIDEYVETLMSMTSALWLPKIYLRYLELEMYPYIKGEKGWDACYKSFLNTLELYASE